MAVNSCSHGWHGCHWVCIPLGRMKYVGSLWLMSDSLDCQWWGLDWLPSRLAGF